MYTIKKVDHEIKCMCDLAWNTAEIADVANYNWEEYKNIPHTEARMLWSNLGVHVLMKTDDKPIIATETRQNGDVYKDTCMELFICPNINDERYINFEFNAFGTNYFSVRWSRDNVDEYESTKYGKGDFSVQTKVTENEWTLMFTIPFAVVDDIFGSHTDVMRGNIYKCVESLEPMHFASYYPVIAPQPDFHRPECFGEFVLQ